MMKKLFGIFIPLCIFSFIAFGISAAVLGTGYGSRYASGAVYELESAATVDYGIGGDVSCWDIAEIYSDIRLDIGAYNVTIIPGQEGDNTTYFTASRVDGDMVDIYTEVSGDTLVVTIDDSFKFINFGFDYLDRLFEAIRTGEGFENIFGGSRLDIIVPPQVYHSLEVNMGSGSVEITDINAKVNNLYLGSGSMRFFNQNGFNSDSLYIDVNSGYIQAYGAKTREYSVDINSGKCEIFGLSGDGVLTIGSGKGVIGFDSFDGNCDVSMNSGTVDIYVPSNSSMRIDADVNSGSVYVDTADLNSRLRDGDSVTIGGGDHGMYIYLNSGRISISDDSAVNEAAAVEIPPIDFAVITDGGAAATPLTEAEEETGLILNGGKRETQIISIPEAPQPPEAPSAPKAPSAPSFAASIAYYAQG